MKRYDAIVVGAGPAGSMTAYRLASAGADVLLLDRARFPRDKPCGGGVTGRAARLVPFPLDPVVEEVVNVAELRLGFRRAVERVSAAPLAFMTQRRRLDQFLAGRAAEAGADFRDGVRVTAVETTSEGAAVEAGGERYTAETVVGADGVNGVSARALELGGNRAMGVALEGNLPTSRVQPGRYAGRCVIEFGALPGGYGWVFPKSDHVNVGIGGWEGEGPRLRAVLAELCRAHGADPNDLEDVRGYRLPLRAPNARLARGRGLVVGDAAGLIDPVSGDGMFEGFLSARDAAASVLDLLAGCARSLDPYGPRLQGRLAVNLWASWGVKAAFDRFPRATFAVARTRIVWHVVERLVTGELRHVSDVQGPVRAPLKAIALLARAAGDPGRGYRE